MTVVLHVDHGNQYNYLRIMYHNSLEFCTALSVVHYWHVVKLVIKVMKTQAKVVSTQIIQNFIRDNHVELKDTIT